MLLYESQVSHHHHQQRSWTWKRESKLFQIIPDILMHAFLLSFFRCFLVNHLLQCSAATCGRFRADRHDEQRGGTTRLGKVKVKVNFSLSKTIFDLFFLFSSSDIASCCLRFLDRLISHFFLIIIPISPATARILPLLMIILNTVRSWERKTCLGSS